MTYTYQTIMLNPQQTAKLDEELNKLGRGGFHLVSLTQNSAGGIIAVMEKQNPPAAG